MKKLTILWLSLLSISGCSTLNIYDSKNNNPITKITSEKINNENRLIGLTNYTITDTNTGGIESYYSLKSGDKKIEARYETDKAGKSKITGLGLDIKPEPGSSHDIYQAIPLNSKNELNAILADLKSLKVDDNAKKEELQILINLIEGKEVAFYLERINLMAEKTFIEFKPLNLPKEFNLSIKEPGYYFKLEDPKTKEFYFTRGSDFFLNNEGLAVGKINNSSLIPGFSLISYQSLKEIDNLGEVKIIENGKFETSISRIYLYRFKNPQALQNIGNSFFKETLDSGKSEEINLKELTIQERLKFKK